MYLTDVKTVHVLEMFLNVKTITVVHITLLLSVLLMVNVPKMIKSVLNSMPKNL